MRLTVSAASKRGVHSIGGSPTCRDSLHAESIELVHPSSARHHTRSVRVFSGQCTPVDRFIALRTGDELRQPFTIYTEEQPVRSTYVRYLVYEKR